MISKKTQYSIYALVRMGKEFEKGPLLISEIARLELIPKKFLEAILLDLKNAGFVNSKKGKGGGYYLIKNPKDISLADVIRHFEGAIALLPCAAYKYYESCSICRDEETCGVRSVIKDVREETVRVLKTFSINDIIQREEKLTESKYRQDAEK
jgi:Rrf2 family protein